MAVRESIVGLSQSAPRLNAFRDAFAQFQALGDDRSYRYFASLHGLTQPIWCEHGTTIGNEYQGSLLFLPWHRAFLYYFELALQTRLGPRFTQQAATNPDFANVGLPWWDWSSDESHRDGIPPAYSSATVDGQPNVLASSEIPVANSPIPIGVWSNALTQTVRERIPGTLTGGATPRTVRDPGPPDELPRRSTVDSIVLTQPNYESFTNSAELVHNDVHGWVGGSMSVVPTSAFDPIFWSHHCMIDRLWYIWQNSPQGEQPPAQILDTVLAPFPMTVADTLNINLLGYEYAVQSIAFT